MESCTLFANAKINIGLNVVERRTDGYHNLQTVFYPTKLADEISFKKDYDADGICLKDNSTHKVDCNLGNNLIVRTYNVFKEKYNIGGIKVELSKHIPTGAGLGGGSSDAAYTALAINSLFDLNLTNDELKSIVSRLGADCAFFIDNTPSYAEGIGEILTPIRLSLSGYTLILIKPDESVSTAEAYSGVNPQYPIIPLLEAISKPVDQWSSLVINDFEATIFPKHPILNIIKDKLYSLGATYSAMSGSGATIYGIFESGKCPSEEKLRAEFEGCFVYKEIL